MCAARDCALETHKVKIWDVRKGCDMFGIRNESRTVSFFHPKDECCVCSDEGGLKMPCGHYICPDDILNHTWVQLKHLKCEISCASCPVIIKFEDIVKFGLPDDEEKQFIEAAISVNFCESQDIQQCPNCQSYCQRIKSDTAQVICTMCRKRTGDNYEFCWFCLRKWKNEGNYQICGNQNCMREEIEKLRKCAKKDFRDCNGKILSVPTLRACPECFTVIEHKSGCNEMTCVHCHTAFCFICLSLTRDGSLVCNGRTFTTITCVPAPTQTKLRQ